MSAGSVVLVEEVTAGSELAADVTAGATSITVEDPADFQPDGGELRIGPGADDSPAVPDTPAPVVLEYRAELAAGFHNGTGSTFNITLAAGASVGDVLVLCLGWQHATAVLNSVTDTAGNAWTIGVQRQHGSGVTSATALVYTRVTSPLVAGNTLAIAFSASIITSRLFSVQAFDGFGTAVTLGPVASNQGTTTTLSTGTTAAGEAGELAVAVYDTVNTGRTFATDDPDYSDFTTTVVANPGFAGSLLTQYRVLEDASGEEHTATMSSSSQWTAAIMRLRGTPEEVGDGDGGEALPFEETGYDDVDEETGIIVLDAPLEESYTAGERVITLPRSRERFAHVQLENQEETLQARVPHVLYDRLGVGLRDAAGDEVELVELDRDPAGELVVVDVLNREPTVDGAYIAPATLPPVEVTTDGTAPSVSPTPTVLGGVLSLFVQWTTVANADPVTYEVHVSTSSGFAPSTATYAGESRGTLFVIRTLPGTLDPPAYGTTYYVRLVAKDDDGSAPAGTETAATPADGMQDAIVADLIAANAVLADKLESVLVLAGTLVAGNPDAGRLEVGIASDDSGRVGAFAYDEDGTTVNFSVDAETALVYLRGRLDFGTGSRLLAEDVVELAEQPAGFQTPTLVQATGGGSVGEFGAGSTASVAWPTPTTKGNLLLLSLTIYDDDGSVPTPTTPAGWTLVASTLHGSSGTDARTSLFKIEGAASRSGTETVTLGDSVHWGAQLFEYAGVGAQDVAAATTKGTSSTASSGTTGTTTQAAELWIAVLATGSTGPAQSSPSNSFSLLRTNRPWPMQESVYSRVVSATGAAGMSATLSVSVPWGGVAVAFKAKVATVETPEANRVRLFAREVASAARLHTMLESGTEGAVVLGKAGEVWRLEYVAATVDIPSTVAHTGFTATAATIPGLAVGDLCFFLGHGGTGRNFIIYADPVCTVAGQITLQGFNADSATQDPAAHTFHFLVIHRS